MDSFALETFLIIQRIVGLKENTFFGKMDTWCFSYHSTLSLAWAAPGGRRKAKSARWLPAPKGKMPRTSTEVHQGKLAVKFHRSPLVCSKVKPWKTRELAVLIEVLPQDTTPQMTAQINYVKTLRMCGYDGKQILPQYLPTCQRPFLFAT